MADNLPYMVAYSRLGEILEKIKSAQTPDRFTADFLSTKLGFSKTSDKAVLSLLKKLGFLGSDGTPTDLYSQFRNTAGTTSGAAMAEGIREAYSELFERNEYAHELSEKELKGLIVEITGSKSNSAMVTRILGTFRTLKDHADFDASQPAGPSEEPADVSDLPAVAPPSPSSAGEVGMNLSYTINLNLPETSDIAVFNAIFSALREHLLRNS